MTAGLGATTLANKWLDMLRGVAFTAPAAAYVKLHVGDPGASGTANPSAVVTRLAATITAAAAGSTGAISNAPEFTMTATETISHLSVWDASTAGNFLWSVALTVSKSVVATDILRLDTLGMALTPIAA